MSHVAVAENAHALLQRIPVEATTGEQDHTQGVLGRCIGVGTGRGSPGDARLVEPVGVEVVGADGGGSHEAHRGSFQQGRVDPGDRTHDQRIGVYEVRPADGAAVEPNDFAVLVENLEESESSCRIADNLLDTLRRPLAPEDSPTYLAPRLGMSLWPRDSEDGMALLRNAYIAMFRARVERAAKPCVYSAAIAREVEVHAQLERALVSAMERGEFEVYYQPQVNTTDGRVIGVEALLRWHNPELGLVYPGTFIPVAEHNGLIPKIGSWVLKTACRQVQQWNTAGLGPLRLAVNLSPLQFVEGDLFADVRNALGSSGLSPQDLELEVTESALMKSPEQAVKVMQALKEHGVHFAIDDFGTGYSSLSQLQHFPFDRIKIDRSFTRDIHSHPDVREITLTIINMAKRLHRQVIAEGVETASQVKFLENHGCDELQGYLFGHPLPATELSQLLRRGPASEKGRQTLLDPPPAG